MLGQLASNADRVTANQGLEVALPKNGSSMSESGPVTPSTSFVKAQDARSPTPRPRCRPAQLLPGKAPTGANDGVLRTFIGNLKFAAAELKKANRRLLIKPINT